MGAFFESGIDKLAKGEGWAPPFNSCAQNTVGLSPLLPLRLLVYRELLPFQYSLLGSFQVSLKMEFC